MTIKQIKALIAKTRESSGLKRSEVAALLKCSCGHIWAVEKGSAAPSTSFCEDFARHLAAPAVALHRWELEAAVRVSDLDEANDRCAYWAGQVEVVP